jgi:hypothetical protein
MNPVQQELFDLAILRVLDANRTRFGLTVTSLGHLVAQFGFPSPNEELLLDRIDYLTRKELVEEVLKGVNAANRAWRITPAGLTHVDERG